MQAQSLGFISSASTPSLSATEADKKVSVCWAKFHKGRIVLVDDVDVDPDSFRIFVRKGDLRRLGAEIMEQPDPAQIINKLAAELANKQTLAH